MIDSYEQFIDGLGINYEDYLEWGIDNTIYPQDSEIEKFWNDLKSRINSGREIYIRGYGRNGRGNAIIISFYSELGISVKIDPSNNMKPTQNLQKLTGMRKNIDIINYQVSHIFGKTKNVYMFECPWNICFVPKMFDPLTGHEAGGKFPIDYKDKWISSIRDKYKAYIDEYNCIMQQKMFSEILESFLIKQKNASNFDAKQLEKFREDMANEFSLI